MTLIGLVLNPALPANPWSTLNASAWTVINNALVNSDVIVYFSTLESDGTTPESKSTGDEIKRTDAAAGNFQPILGSILINAGVLISSFSNE